MDETPSDPALAATGNYEKNVVASTTGPFATFLIEHAGPQPGERALDVACGTGRVARKTAPHVGATGAVVGADISPAMIAYARSLPPKKGAAIDWREGSAEERAELAQAVETEIAPASQKYLEGIRNSTRVPPTSLWRASTSRARNTQIAR